MIKRTIIAAAMLVAIAGCTQTSAPEFATYNGERIEVAATATPGLFNAGFIVTINGQTVIDDRTEAFGGSSQTFTGTWNGKNVTARATRVQNFVSAYTQIDVFIDGQHVETLTV